MDIDKAMKNIV
jgi:hypothetical protein